jgi:hypothetical protein
VILSSHLLSDVEDVCDRRGDLLRRQNPGGGHAQELLATPDTLRITTPVLPRETMERVLDDDSQRLAADKCRIDTPTQNLKLLPRGRAEGASGGAETRERLPAPRCGLSARRAKATATERIWELTCHSLRPAVASATQPMKRWTEVDALTKPEDNSPAQATAAEEKPVIWKADEKLFFAAQQAENDGRAINDSAVSMQRLFAIALLT